ncbi:MAG: hypothetical protein K2J10_05505 [Muribaculaceae bacterium]|nr:hypothetical protein [Muribaculaceae bacterium]
MGLIFSLTTHWVSPSLHPSPFSHDSRHESDSPFDFSDYHRVITDAPWAHPYKKYFILLTSKLIPKKNFVPHNSDFLPH